MPLPLCLLPSPSPSCQEISPPSSASLRVLHSLPPSLRVGKRSFLAKSKAFISAFQNWE